MTLPDGIVTTRTRSAGPSRAIRPPTDSRNACSRPARNESSSIAITRLRPSAVNAFVPHGDGPAAQAGDAARYASGKFSNTAWTGHLGQYEPDPADAANDLHANTTFRSNAITAGLPANFFVMNPNVTKGNITRSLAGTRYNALRFDRRRRFSKGFLMNANYTYARRLGSSLQSLRLDRIYLESTDVPHAFKTQWTWQLAAASARSSGGSAGNYIGFGP